MKARKRVDNRFNKKPSKAKGGGDWGATRQASEPSRKWGRYVMAVVFLIVSSFGVAHLDWQAVYAKAYKSANRPLANITIEGEFKFVSKEDLQSLISSKLDGSFVDLDLQDVKLAIEENAWVDYVTIERIWPDSLLLKVAEHKPIARWNGNGFISNDGELIKSGDNVFLMDLPLLSGGERDSREVAKNYVSFSNILNVSNLKLSGLRVDENMSWIIDVDNAFTLVLGRYEIQQRLENFQYVFESYLEKKKHKINRVDMRYERGLAVEWKSDSEFVAASSVE